MERSLEIVNSCCSCFAAWYCWPCWIAQKVRPRALPGFVVYSSFDVAVAIAIAIATAAAVAAATDSVLGFAEERWTCH